MRVELALVMMLVGCVRSDAVSCSDGRICPASLVCDNEHALCVAEAQVTACATMPDGSSCMAGAFAGTCDRGVCVEGCSDGTVGYDWRRSRPEECDDGNLRSHDGCSSACRTELPGWTEWRSPWHGRVGAAAAYDLARDVLVMVGGFVQGAISDDHWERDSQRNWRRLDVARPPARWNAMLAYDEARSVVVLFGGHSGTYRADTWEYDGTTWREIATPTSPPARGSAAMWFDSVRQTVVLFGGTDGTVRDDTWEYDGATWAQVSTTGTPSARSHAAYAWDSTRQRALLFGGSPQNAQTWEWNGTTATWSAVTTTGAPSGRIGASMTFQSTTGEMLLFGGQRSSTVSLGDLWRYNAGTQTWSQVVAENSAPPRGGAVLIWDRVNSVLVLATGAPLFDVGRNDVWEYNGSYWYDVTPSFPSRQQARMVEDTARGELVVLDRNGTTWVFDRDQNWVAAATQRQPPFMRRFFGVAYDSTRGRVVAFGGDNGCVAFDGTLVWDGAARMWSEISTSQPGARTVPAMVYDPRRDRVVLAGGQSNVCSAATEYVDSWELDPAAGAWTSVGTAPHLTELTFDDQQGRLVGLASDGATWVHDGSAWTALTLPEGPQSNPIGAMTFNPDRQRVTWYGGAARPGHSDLWELEADGWRELHIVGQQPVGRSYPALASHRPSRSLVLLGGGAFGTTIGDTWLFRFSSDDPDERCDDAIDNDDDLLVDASDPDCQ